MLRYNVEEDVTISVDASKTGLGAVLLQRIQPVAYASRSPTISEQNNALIEECLAVLFGCHQYAYGKEIMIENDHQPLEAFPRFQIAKIKHVCLQEGKQFHIADALRRAHLKKTPEDLNFLKMLNI